jgi:hypothetical protein
MTSSQGSTAPCETTTTGQSATAATASDAPTVYQRQTAVDKAPADWALAAFETEIDEDLLKGLFSDEEPMDLGSGALFPVPPEPTAIAPPESTAIVPAATTTTPSEPQRRTPFPPTAQIAPFIENSRQRALKRRANLDDKLYGKRPFPTLNERVRLQTRKEAEQASGLSRHPGFLPSLSYHIKGDNLRLVDFKAGKYLVRLQEIPDATFWISPDHITASRLLPPQHTEDRRNDILVAEIAALEQRLLASKRGEEAAEMQLKAARRHIAWLTQRT